jgi:hypothetical protein
MFYIFGKELAIKLFVHFSTIFLGLSLSTLAFAQAVTTASPVTVPDGSVLWLGDSCYTLTTKNKGAEQTIGFVFQRIQRQQVDGVDALAIEVHQHLLSGKFDMRDRFLLRRADLRPLRLDTDRDGVPHVHLDYAGDHATGWKMVKGVKEKIDVKFDGPVWEGNLWGVTFAALPLEVGKKYQLPIYQYDSGKGSFFVRVTDRQKPDTPKGIADAWILEAGAKPSERTRYLVGIDPRMELGYSAGSMSQHIGGDCTEQH